jgi:type I restriction enzyme S subunit
MSADLSEKTKRLSDVAHILMGQSPPSSAVGEKVAGFPFLQGNAEFTERFPVSRLRCSAGRLCEPGDMLLSVRAPVGEINQANQQFVIGRGLCAIRFHALPAAYGWHALKHVVRDLDRVAQGSTFAAVGRDDVEALRILWFEGDQPAKIAAVLDAVDDAIDKTEAVIAKLRVERIGLRESMMTCGTDNTDWRHCKLGDLIESTEYGISSALRNERGSPVLRMNNFADGEAVLDELRFTRAFVPAKLMLRTGDVLFNRTNSYEHVGRTGIWRGQLPGATFASYLVRLNPKPRLLRNEYLNLLLNLRQSQIAMRRFATPAVAQVNINPTNLRALPVEVPSDLEAQDEVVAAATKSREAIVRMEKELVKLRSIKAGCATDLLAGGVAVPGED